MELSDPFPTDSTWMRGDDIAKLVRILNELAISYRAVTCDDARLQVNCLDFGEMRDRDGLVRGVKSLCQLSGRHRCNAPTAVVHEARHEGPVLSRVQLTQPGAIIVDNTVTNVTLEGQLVGFVSCATAYLNRQIRLDTEFWRYALGGAA